FLSRTTEQEKDRSNGQKGFHETFLFHLISFFSKLVLTSCKIDECRTKNLEYSTKENKRNQLFFYIFVQMGTLLKPCNLRQTIIYVPSLVHNVQIFTTTFKSG
ncbi:MAG: hypothetical protein OQK71_05475, partial [Desulfobacter sp.]|nr:hypothetical protein [Desulfobacter sp.]